MSQHHKSTRNMRKLKEQFKTESHTANLPCWMCGMPIDYDAPHDDWDNPDRYQLDHYYPASTHPEHYEDPANFRPSHAACNNERSDGAPSAGLGTLSRQWITQA